MTTPVFAAPWQARAFGMVLALLEQRGEEWSSFQPYLVAAIEAQPDADYYDSLLVALESFAAAACDNPSL